MNALITAAQAPLRHLFAALLVAAVLVPATTSVAFAAPEPVRVMQDDTVTPEDTTEEGPSEDTPTEEIPEAEEL